MTETAVVPTAATEPQDGAPPPAGGGEQQQPAAEDRKRSLEDRGECIAIKVTYGKQSVTTSRPLLSTVASLKADVAAHTGLHKPACGRSGQRWGVAPPPPRAVGRALLASLAGSPDDWGREQDTATPPDSAYVGTFCTACKALHRPFLPAHLHHMRPLSCCGCRRATREPGSRITALASLLLVPPTAGAALWALDVQSRGKSCMPPCLCAASRRMELPLPPCPPCAAPLPACLYRAPRRSCCSRGCSRTSRRCRLRGSRAAPRLSSWAAAQRRSRCGGWGK